MTREAAKELLKPFIEKCDEHKDPYFYCFFSRQEDKFDGDWEGLDFLDASIIVKQLVKSFPEIKMLFHEQATT